MAGNQTRLQAYLEEEIKKYKGVYVPIKSGVLRRPLVRRASCQRLHPNPHDVFCDPKVGPATDIVSKYEKDIGVKQQHAQTDYFKEPLIVERIHPDGYMILNSHHRWAAAMLRNLKAVPIRIVNLTHAGDIERMLQNARHAKLASLDLDEWCSFPIPRNRRKKPCPFPQKGRFGNGCAWARRNSSTACKPWGTRCGCIPLPSVRRAISKACFVCTA